LAALVCALAAHTAWADMATDMNTTLGTLSTDTSAAATTSNVSLLQNKVDALNAQIAANQRILAGMSSSRSGYATMQSQIAQQQAAASALQSIISRLQQGYTITSYETSTDASTLVTSVTMGFSKTTGSGSTASTSTATLTTEIPPITPDSGDVVTDDGSSSGSNSSGYDSADMLTQMLQQMAMQQMMGGAGNPLTGMMGSLGGGGNPLSAIQPTLTNLVTGNGGTAAVQANNQKATDCPPGTGQGDGVAVYDIAAGKVYMPDGTVLDAHSGMGNMMDNPDYVNQPNSGPTPPNTYNLSLRESPYFGVEALRLTPTDPGSMYGRSGILAHTKLVRGNNGSHGCVAFVDYAKFLAAFKSGQVKQLVVVPRGAKPKTPKTCRPPAYDKPHGGTGSISI
jgi:hypothetical protein